MLTFSTAGAAAPASAADAVLVPGGPPFQFQFHLSRKGFVDFYNLGLIKKLPQLVAVQAEKSDAK